MPFSDTDRGLFHVVLIEEKGGKARCSNSGKSPRASAQ